MLKKVLDFHRLWNWYLNKLHLDFQEGKEASAYLRLTQKRHISIYFMKFETACFQKKKQYICCTISYTVTLQRGVNLGQQVSDSKICGRDGVGMRRWEGRACPQERCVHV